MTPLIPLALLGAILFASKNVPSDRERNVFSLGAQSVPPGQGTSGYATISQQDMQMVQHDLTWLGYFHGPMHGQYDEATAHAVGSFQDDHGLVPADGLPGPETLEMLESIVAAQP